MSVNLEDRKRTRCKPCGLVQFVSAKKQCVRCHKPYHETQPAEVPAASTEVKPALDGNPVDGKAFDFEFWTAFVLWDSRQAVELSQSQLGQRMKVARTYVSKVEAGRAMPHVQSFQRFCTALETSSAFMVRKIEFLVTGQ